MSEARRLLSLGLAISTRTTYSSPQRAYLRFASMYGVQPLPATEDTLCLWVAELARHVSRASIDVYLYAVRSLHVDMGLPLPPRTDRLVRIVDGVERDQAHIVKRKRFPITTSVLQQMRAAVAPRTAAELCMMAAWSIATAGLLRGNEFAAVYNEPERAPRLRDLTFADGHARLHLRISKTDQFGRGTDVHIAYPPALADLRAYLATRTTLDPAAPLFATASGKPLALRAVMLAAHAALVRAGVDLSKYRGLSFRRGGASSLAIAGVPDRVVRQLGRWKSSAYVRYIDMPLASIVDAAAAM